ncbi:MAG: hypothetical protein BJ554DRAFT_4871, partial [Olpidium bornovanus]
MTQVDAAADVGALGTAPDAPASPDVHSLKAAAAAAAAAPPLEAPGEEADVGGEEGFVALTEDGGLKKRVLKEGSGESVPKGANVEGAFLRLFAGKEKSRARALFVLPSVSAVHYVGTLYPSGKKFDASRDRDAPFNFRLGQGNVKEEHAPARATDARAVRHAGQVIKGWDVGVQSMRVGELAELLCKPEYAYGAAGSPPNIPANSTLKFEVEVLGFEEVAETPEQHWAAAKSKREEGNRAFRDGKFAAAKA